MLHHISLGVSNIERAATFYDAALEPLGYVRVWEDIRPGEPDQAVGYGLPGGGDKLALKFRPKGQRAPGAGFHLAFAAPDRASVARFHAGRARPWRQGQWRARPASRLWTALLCGLRRGPGRSSHRGGLQRAGIAACRHRR